jgi:CDP-6-deoxy-D-xylo-4-hexulose-3-dehydrase
MVMFNDEKLRERALRIRDWGRAGGVSEDFEERFNHGLLGEIKYDAKFIYVEFGYNLKACEANAAFGLIQLEKLPEFEKKRTDLFIYYLDLLKGNEYASRYYRFPDAMPSTFWLAMPLACPDRTELLKVLEDAQIQTRVTMAGNILRHQIYKHYFEDEAKRDFPVSDQVMKEGFLLGCHHGMERSDVERVCKALIAFATKKLKDQK